MLRNRLFTLVLGIAGVASFGSVASAASVCPSTANTNTDCGFIITLGMGGSIKGMAVAGANPYDGSDDALIGVVNNTGSVFNGSFTLSGSGNGGGLFAFDGDGICTFTNASYCSTAATGYEGPLNTFSKINASGTSGSVDITGLAAGASTYFSLESSPASINGGGGPSIGGSTPEPATNVLLGSGILLVGLVSRRVRRVKRAA